MCMVTDSSHPHCCDITPSAALPSCDLRYSMAHFHKVHAQHFYIRECRHRKGFFYAEADIPGSFMSSIQGVLTPSFVSDCVLASSVHCYDCHSKKRSARQLSTSLGPWTHVLKSLKPRHHVTMLIKAARSGKHGTTSGQRSTLEISVCMCVVVLPCGSCVLQSLGLLQTGPTRRRPSFRSPEVFSIETSARKKQPAQRELAPVRPNKLEDGWATGFCCLWGLDAGQMTSTKPLKGSIPQVLALKGLSPVSMASWDRGSKLPFPTL